MIIEGRVPCGGCGPGPVIIVPIEEPSQHQLDLQWMNEKIIDNTNNPCVQNTLSTLKTISDLLPDILRTIFGTTEEMDFDITLTLENLGSGQGGNTTKNVNDNHFQVQINSFFDNATDLSVATTLIHEALHCQLMNWYRQAYLENDTQRRDWLALHYGYVFSQESIAWDNNLAAIVYGANGASQHQDIATRYIDAVSNALFQFAIAKGIPNVTLAYCRKLALSGCSDSQYFQSLSLTEQQNILESIINPEKDPNGNSVNINHETAKGIPCL